MESFGGTWLTHNYPGIRSDSDLYTFGYRFKPWTGRADRLGRRDPQIHGRGDRRERPRPAHPLPATTIASASWSSEDNLLDDRGVRTDTGEPVRFTASFLWMCQGYYRHAEGYTPDWAGMDRFKGRIVHPQTWPEDLDYKDKQVVVIGSGATAATLVPAIAGRLRPRHPAAALADLFLPGPQPQSSWPTRCANWTSTRPGSTRSCDARSCSTSACSSIAR